MVLTDRQRQDLHIGIYEYFKSRPGEEFQKVAEALAEADPSAISKSNGDNTSKTPSSAPILEKKWTAVPRLQKKVMELERALTQASKNVGIGAATGIMAGGASGVGSRRMLPRAPCAHTLQGHSNTVTSVAVHPIFTITCSGSDDATIKVWDHESGEYIKSLKGHTGTVHSLCFTPLGSHLASSSSDLSIKLWDFKTYNCIRTLRGHDHTISSISFIPSPALISQGTSKASSTTSAPQNTTSTTGIDINAAGTAYLISGSRDKTMKVWELETGFCVHTVQDHSDWVRCLAVRPDGGFIASSGSDFVINLYKLNNAADVPKMSEDLVKHAELRGHEHVVESIAFITNSPLATKEAVETSVSTNSSPSKASSSVKKLAEAATYLASGGRDRTVRLWSINSMECLAVFSFHENWVRSVLIHPSGNYIFSAGDDRTIRVLDIKSNRCLRTLDSAHQHFVTSLSMHYSLPILVSGGVDHVVNCWTLD